MVAKPSTTTGGGSGDRRGLLAPKGARAFEVKKSPLQQHRSSGNSGNLMVRPAGSREGKSDSDCAAPATQRYDRERVGQFSQRGEKRVLRKRDLRRISNMRSSLYLRR